jgi:hypothetical protein
VQIAVVNESTHVSEAEFRAMCSAVGAQLARHVAPAWGRAAWPVVPYRSEKDAPAGACVIAILDDPDQADALGYHSETPGGLTYGRVFVKPVLDAGGEVLTGTLSVSSVLSHEAIEAFGDAFVNLWADGPDGRSWAFELCDAVQGDGYPIQTRIGAVWVSNFLFPEFFDDMPAPGARFDQMKRLSGPFSLAPGGYSVVRVAGTVSQIGAALPPWKNHPAARSVRRSA